MDVVDAASTSSLFNQRHNSIGNGNNINQFVSESASQTRKLASKRAKVVINKSPLNPSLHDEDIRADFVEIIRNLEDKAISTISRSGVSSLASIHS